jgi:hypothetical protein
METAVKTVDIEHGASIDAAQATPGSYREPGQSLRLDQIGIPEAAFAWDHGIKVGGRDFASMAQGLRPVLISVALSAVLALGLIGGFRFLVFAPASTAIEHKPDCSDRALDSNATSCVAPDREAILSVPKVQNIAAPAAMTNGSGHELSRSTTQKATPSTNTVTLATHETSPRPRAVAIQQARSLSRLTPVPETRPTTIEGWTVRDVVGGTAVLEGPNGQWRVTSGDTVPGLGKVDSIVRWGSRWIVATSKGLVSTP